MNRSCHMTYEARYPGSRLQASARNQFLVSLAQTRGPAAPAPHSEHRPHFVEMVCSASRSRTAPLGSAIATRKRVCLIGWALAFSIGQGPRAEPVTSAPPAAIGGG